MTFPNVCRQPQPGTGLDDGDAAEHVMAGRQLRERAGHRNHARLVDARPGDLDHVAVGGGHDKARSCEKRSTTPYGVFRARLPTAPAAD